MSLLESLILPVVRFVWWFFSFDIADSVDFRSGGGSSVLDDLQESCPLVADGRRGDKR